MVAVDRVNLEVHAGEFLSLLGPSGCGKTTTLRMLAGFEQPDDGYIRISGEFVQGVPPYKRDVEHGVPALRLVPPHDRGRERGLRPAPEEGAKAEMRRRVGEALEMVKMTKLANRKPRQMSGGQQQRVALARALVNRPSVLLLDEPLGALDRKLRQEMQIELKLLQTQVGITFIYVTHDQEEALSMSRSHRGHARRPHRTARRSRHDLRAPASAFVAGFIGQNNFLRRPSHRRRLEPDGPCLRREGHEPRARRRRAVNRRWPRSVRVERARCRAPPARRPTSLAGTLAGISHLGDVIQYVVHRERRSDIIVRLPRHHAPRAHSRRSRVVHMAGRCRARSSRPARPTW